MSSFEEEEGNDSTPLEEFLSLVQSDSSLASLLFSKKDPSQPNLLLETCQHLFQHVESLNQTLHQLENAEENDTSLSGLTEIYTGEDTTVDAETIWGQVDLQNEALHGLLKKSVRKLASATTDEPEAIRVLNLESEVLNEEDDESNSDSDDNEEEEEEEDEEARRMRERMERTLEDMDDDDDDDDEEEEEEDEYEDTRFFGKKKSTKPKPKQSTTATAHDLQDDDDEDSQDPAVQELNNGFFDIHEMEAFADEEEDMLPEQVWEPTPAEGPSKKKSNKSFHQRQREGMEESDDDEEEEEVLQSMESAKRKKYREDDEIEALYGMYTDTGLEEEDDADLDDAVNMTAADLFGAPNKKYLHKWKAQQEKDKQSSKKSKAEKQSAKKNKADSDDDSWDAYKFDQAEADWGGDDQDDKEDPKPKAKGKGKATKDDDDDPDSDDDDDSKNSESGDDNSDDDGDKKPKAKQPAAKPKSQHAQQSEKLKQETLRLESEMLREKPWQMVGEAAATARPVNSLLQGTPEFSVASKMAPVITEQHTANLEEIIQRRILAEDWDDVLPRELPDVAWHKKRGELPEVSQEKAKLGLGELYEREYLKKAVGYDKDAAEKESEQDKAKNEMKQLFANICSKLDALSNYHFAPRPMAEEPEVRPATTPAIAMEEILPLHVSDARGAAPEEVYGKKRGRDGILRSETELEQTERKRIRSAKKAARRKSRKEKAADNKLIARVQPGLGLNNPYEKRKAQEEVSMARAEGRITDGQADAKSGYGSSNKFFRQMQEDVSKTLRDGQPEEQDQKKQSARSRKSSSFKM